METQIFIQWLDTRVVERITDHSSIDTSPSFSPDGKYIALILTEVACNRSMLCVVMEAELRELPLEKDLWDTSLVTKRRFDCIYQMRKGRFYIGVMRIDGSGERLLTENYYQEAPSWSPNGRVLVFIETKAGSKAKVFAIMVHRYTGYNERRLKTETDASDPSGPLFYLNKLYFKQNTLE